MSFCINIMAKGVLGMTSQKPVINAYGKPNVGRRTASALSQKKQRKFRKHETFGGLEYFDKVTVYRKNMVFILLQKKES